MSEFPSDARRIEGETLWGYLREDIDMDWWEFTYGPVDCDGKRDLKFTVTNEALMCPRLGAEDRGEFDVEIHMAMEAMRLHETKVSVIA